MSDDPSQQGTEISDLIGVEVTVGLIIWFLVVLACFFFIGAVAGMIAVIAGVIAGVFLGWRVISRADTTG